MAGIDIPIPELQLTLTPPTIKDIAFMGEDNFFTAIHYLCLDKSQLVEDESLLQDLTNFQVLMKVIEQSESKEKKTVIITMLSILFPQYNPMITPRSIILRHRDTGDSTLIDSDNFAIDNLYVDIENPTIMAAITINVKIPKIINYSPLVHM